MTLCLTKASLSLYFDSLTPIRLQKTINLALGGVIGLWGLSSLFVVAFQCKVPTTWDIINGKYIDTYAFWTYFGIVNILTDVGLIFLPFMILNNLQVETKKKSIILICFASRILSVPVFPPPLLPPSLTNPLPPPSTIAATIAQLYFLHRDISHSTDLPYDLWMPTIMTQTVQALSIITACIPYLKPFLEALETGMIRAGGGAQKFGGPAGGSPAGGSPTAYTSTPSSSRFHKLAFLKRGQPSRQSGGVRMDDLGGAFGAAVAGEGQMQATTVSANRRGVDSDAESQNSQSNIIKKTVDWTLTDEVKGVAI